MRGSRKPRAEGRLHCLMVTATVLAGALMIAAVATTDAQVSFSQVTTDTDVPPFEVVVAVADLNGDGRDDIVVGETDEDFTGVTPEDRLTKTTLHLFVGDENGTFTHAPELVQGTIEVRTPIVVAADFNADTQIDLAVFDFGAYVLAHSYAYGNPPQLFLSSQDGVLRPSNALADAVRREHELRPDPEYSGPSDLHLKSATSGDIDGDGDTDLWVESTGGANVKNHFMVNNGDGTFTIEPDRAPYELLHNPPPEFWRHHVGHLVDLNNDGDRDLALGQMRDLDPTHINQFSLVLVNDGTGHYPVRVELPHPAFNDGHTQVAGLTHFDVNGDGYQDLLLVHQRNDDGPANVTPWTGRYIQVLINRNGTSFGDETSTWMGDQSATLPERTADGYKLGNGYNATPKMHDVDRDGCLDLVISRVEHPVGSESPLVYRNNGSGQFQAMSPEPFAPDSRIVPADVNGDGIIDFVFPRPDKGPDRTFETADDFTALETLLNTTPAGSIRCNPRVTAVGTLPAQTLNVGAEAVVVSVAGAFQDASTYEASLSTTGVATVSVSGTDVTVTPLAAGMTIVTVTASGADNSIATQQFTVTVLAVSS